MLNLLFPSVPSYWWNALRFRSPRKSQGSCRLFFSRQFLYTVRTNHHQSLESKTINETGSSRKDAPKALQDHFAWSILFDSHTRTTLLDETAVLDKLDTAKKPIRQGRIPLLLLFITPAYIDLFRDGSSFIPNLLDRIFELPEPGQKFDVATAVVDLIPYPLTDEFSAREIRNRDRYGCEGISFMVLDAETAAPDIWSTTKQVDNQRSVTVPQPAVISFKIEYRDIDKPSSSRKTKSELSKTSLTFELPIANTLFQNGRTSTMFAMRWTLVPTTESKLDFVCNEMIELSHQMFTLIDLSPRNKLQSQLSIDIKQITPPRVVAAAFGNIVRKVFKGKDPEEEMPASKDLQEAVGQLFDAQNQTKEQVVVWALVTPRERHIDQPVTEMKSLQDMIECGSRLHRVLGGGGGWGAKDGLLALDPRSQYFNDLVETHQIFGEGEDGNLNMSDVLGKIIKPGDVIAFFVQKNPDNYKERLHHSSEQNWKCWRKASLVPSIHLGTLPPSSESLSSDTASEEQPQTSDPVLVRNHFGMLSEHGMSLKVETHPLESIEPSSTVVTTKIDVPFSYFSTQIQAKPTEVD